MSQQFLFSKTAWFGPNQEPQMPEYTCQSTFGPITVRLITEEHISISSQERWLIHNKNKYDFSATLRYDIHSRTWELKNFELRREQSARNAQIIHDDMHELIRQIKTGAKTLFNQDASQHIKIVNAYKNWHQLAASAETAQKTLALLLQNTRGNPQYETLLKKLIPEAQNPE